jgi:hypothetical protein
MVANDRPSAYRGIFISLFANQETINTRSVLGYYRERRQQGFPSKNTLVMGMNVLNKNNPTEINNIPNTDGDKAVTFTENARNIVNESKNKGRLKNVLRIRRSARQELGNPSSKKITMFFRRYPEFKGWSKQRGIVIQPTNFRKRVRQFAEDFNPNSEPERRINFGPGGNLAWVMRGGKKRRKRKTRKHKKRRKRKTRKHKKRKIKKKKTKRKNRKIKKKKTKRKKRKTKRKKR